MIPIFQIRDKWREEGSERNQSGSQVIKKLGEHENKGGVFIYFSSFQAPELGFCMCEIWILSALNNRSSPGVMISSTPPGDLCYFIFNKTSQFKNSPTVVMTAEEVFLLLSDTNFCIFPLSASEFLTGPTLRTGWRSLRRLYCLPDNSWRWDGAEGD